MKYAHEIEWCRYTYAGQLRRHSQQQRYYPLQANQHVSEPEDLPTANATNPTHARRDLLRDDISGLTGEEGDSCKEVSWECSIVSIVVGVVVGTIVCQ